MDSQFAIVELMGRQCFGAKVQEVEQFGIKMLRCEVLTNPPYERDVHPQSLYALTRCSEERAKLACKFLVSATLMPAERVHVALPAPESPFEDPESDEGPDEDQVADDREAFECEQCGNRETVEFDANHMDVPEGWAAVAPGWSLIPRGSDDDVYFCSESCVRDFLNKPSNSDEEALEPEFPEPDESVEVNESLVMRHADQDEMGDWYFLERKDGVRLTDTRIEGTRSEMVMLARAIQAREGYCSNHCGVRIDRDRVYLWSPRNGEHKAVVPLATADALASEIRSFAAGKSGAADG